MKITLDFAKQTVTIEGSQEDAASLFAAIKDVAPKMKEIRVVMDGGAPSGGVGGEGGGKQKGERTPLAKMTMRDFAKTLAPTVQAERIAVIGYYHCKLQEKESFSPKEMADWLALSGWGKPMVASRAMFDAKKNRGFVENKGHGKWAITVEAENFVVGLIESKDLGG